MQSFWADDRADRETREQVMGKVVLALVFLVLGGILGFFGGAAIGFGGGAGMGIATGLSAGVCGVAKAAQDEGLLTDEQIDQVFARAVGNLRALSPESQSEAEQIVGGAGECDAVLERLRQAAAR